MDRGLQPARMLAEVKAKWTLRPCDPVESYFFLTIQSYTPSLPAPSTLETMVIESRSPIAQVQYVFEMRRLQDAEDKLTTGYGDLRLTSGDKRLEGY